jgi:hypothetical protein
MQHEHTECDLETKITVGQPQITSDSQLWQSAVSKKSAPPPPPQIPPTFTGMLAHGKTNSFNSVGRQQFCHMIFRKKIKMFFNCNFYIEDFKINQNAFII